MKTYQWYPQLDVIDAIRRMASLLAIFPTSTGAERLCIADFYLANPPMLHRAIMSADVRKAFTGLSVDRPEKSFLTYPSPQLLFKRMEAAQRDAVDEMLGKGLIAVDKKQAGNIRLTERVEAKQLYELCSEDERVIAEFIVNAFVGPEDVGNRDLRRRTGLSRL